MIAEFTKDPAERTKWLTLGGRQFDCLNALIAESYNINRGIL